MTNHYTDVCESTVAELRKQLAEQAEAIDLQLHTNRRIAELEEKVAQWVEKAKNWTASPEARKQLEGYRTMGAKCAELEAECDQLRQQVKLLLDAIYEAKRWIVGNQAHKILDEALAATKEQ